MIKRTIRWDLRFRYRMIEVIALWEGRLTTNHLIQSFGIGRQQASKDINTYLSDIAPGNLIYDKQLKGYKPSDSFIPQLTFGHADEYLNILSKNEDITIPFKELDMEFDNTIKIRHNARNIAPEILRPLIQAIREKKRVDISYTSIKDGVEVERIISPHTLVYTPLRWHVRAYCEHAKDYRDFVLSRMRGIPCIEGKKVMGKEHDDLWNTPLTIELIPDSRLADIQAAVVAHDYGMEKGILTIPTNAALIRYILDAYNIDVSVLDLNPKSQQIMVGNFDELKPYLFF